MYRRDVANSDTLFVTAREKLFARAVVSRNIPELQQHSSEWKHQFDLQAPGLRKETTASLLQMMNDEFPLYELPLPRCCIASAPTKDDDDDDNSLPLSDNGHQSVSDFNAVGLCIEPAGLWTPCPFHTHTTMSADTKSKDILCLRKGLPTPLQVIYSALLNTALDLVRQPDLEWLFDASTAFDICYYMALINNLNPTDCNSSTEHATPLMYVENGRYKLTLDHRLAELLRIAIRHGYINETSANEQQVVAAVMNTLHLPLREVMPDSLFVDFEEEDREMNVPAED